RTNDTLAIYKVDPATRMLVNVSAQPPVHFGFPPYGVAMYHSPLTGKYYVFVNSDHGHQEQWELFDAGQGAVSAALVRSFEVGSQTEGNVADDETAAYYVAEEDVAIWRYGAEPGDGSSRVLVDTVAPTGHPTADIEGLTIYHAADGTGYLMASSQGSDEFVL